MRAPEFSKIIVYEKSTINFLQLHNLLPNNSEMLNCKKYDSETKGWLLVNKSIKV